MQRQPITPSGKGTLITDRRVTEFSVQEIRDLIARFDWLAFKNHPVTTDEVIAYLGRFGTLVQNDRRQGAVLKLDGSKKDAGEVLLGDGFMPLHRDGALMGTNVALVGIFCVYHRGVTGGRTFVSDVENATKQVPSEILELVRTHGIEGRPVDTYYMKAPDRWHWIPGFSEVEGKSYLNVGFPYRPGEQPSWLVRMPGVDDARFHEMFETMRAILMSETYCYYHEWDEGDLILLDNRKLLHGREAFRGQRSLANIQVLA